MTLKNNESTLKYPLPPEGQPRHTEDDSDFASSSHSNHPYSPSLSRTPAVADPNTRYWEEGWYIWVTKNRWAVQEKIDLMMFDLEKQTAWQRSKEQDARAWADEDEERRRSRLQAEARTGYAGDVTEGASGSSAVGKEEQEREDELFRTTYLNAA